jgi:hypothetical protein
MLQRLAETDGTIAVPAVIYPKGVIHAVGNLEYENHVDGVTHVHKEHRYWGMPYHRACALPAVQVDYAESHGFACDTARLKRAGGFDEELVEFGEVDTGRRVRAAGGTVWAEPAAVVHTDQDSLIELEDVGCSPRAGTRERSERSRA